MRKKAMSLIVGLLALFLAGCVWALPVPVAQEGTPRATVLLGPEPTFIEQHAAEVLVEYLEKMTGARLSVVQSASLPGKDTALLAIGRGETNPLVLRLIGAGQVVLSAEDPGPDGYILKTTEVEGRPVLVLGGSNDRATLYAIYHLLEEVAQMGLFWDGEYIPSRPTWSVPELDLREAPYFSIRMHGNSCIHCYQMQYWDLAECNRWIDWMATKRMNLVWRMPASTGDVAFKEAFGLPAQASSREVYEGGMVSAWLQYANSLGIEGTRGVGWSVSDEFHDKYPGPYFKRSWLDYPSKWEMDPEHPMWDEYLQTRMRVTNEQQGIGHGWGLSFYAENILRHADDTQMSREEQAEMLQRLARAASETIVEYDPEAYGLMGDSTFISGPQWSAQSAQAFFNSFDPRFEMTVYGIYHDWSDPPTYERYDYFYGAPWAFGFLHSMAGNTWLRGDLPGIIRQLREDVWDNPAGVKCRGFFIVPEVVYWNTVAFELAADLQWDPREVQLDAFLDDYCLRRYGPEGAPAMREAFNHLVAGVYSASREHQAEPAYDRRPMSAYDKFDAENPFNQISVGRIKAQAQFIPDLQAALQATLNAPASAYDSPLYQKDLVEITRHLVALLYNQHYLRLAAAWSRWDRADFEANAQKMRELMDLQVRLLHTNSWFWLQPTIDKAARTPIFGGEKGAGRAVRSKHMYVTDGGFSSIHLLDYYRMDLYELVRDYYSVRVERFLDLLSQEMQSGEPAPIPVEAMKAAYWEIEETYYEQGGLPPEPSPETTVEAVRAILAASDNYWPAPPLNLAAPESVAWSFNALPGDTLEADTGGNGLHLVGNGTWSGESLAGGGLELGAGRAAVLPDDEQTGLDVKYDLTLEAWVYLRDLPPAGQSYPLITKSRGSGDMRAYGMSVQTDKEGHSLVQFYISNDGTAHTWPYRGGGIKGVHSRVPPPVGEWFHLAAVFQSDEELAIYLNGEKIGSVEGVGDGNVPPSIYDSPAVFMLGAYDNGHGEPASYANARLDEVRVSNFARYTERFQAERP